MKKKNVLEEEAKEREKELKKVAPVVEEVKGNCGGVPGEVVLNKGEMTSFLPLNGDTMIRNTSTSF